MFLLQAKPETPMANHCDPETGICIPSTLEELYNIDHPSQSEKLEIIYVGDPMCSWCWGISPALIRLRDYFSEQKIAFKVLVGGLRPGGGSPWDDQMKSFLKHHWQEVSKRSGQPFSFGLLSLQYFNYDTEPACRAIVAIRPLVREKEMEFFEAIQRKFYVESHDPNKASFYASICDDFNINYGEFLSRFESAACKQQTMDEFNLNRQWGIKGYPTVILLHNSQLYQVAHGYATFEEMKSQIEKLVNTAV